MTGGPRFNAGDALAPLPVVGWRGGDPVNWDEDSPLGTRTAEVLAWFYARGWRVNTADVGWLLLGYPHSFSGRFPDDCRIFGDDGTTLSTWDCELYVLDTAVKALLGACSVDEECERHPVWSHRLGVDFDHPDFSVVLGWWEQHAHAIDCAELADCPAFGPGGAGGVERACDLSEPQSVGGGGDK